MKYMQIGKYKHTKSGKEYDILGMAHHSETLDELVVYKAVYDSEKFGKNALWARPKEMFLDDIEVSGKKVKRFQILDDYESNYAFIDGQNLYKGINQLDWELNYYKLRHWLRAKFNVQKAFIFLGYIPKYEALYDKLKKDGFDIIFKEVSVGANGKIKGNVDVQMTLTIRDTVDEYEKALLVTSDGDFADVVKYLKKVGKFGWLLSPESEKCSYLLRKEVGRKVIYLDTVKNKISNQVKRRAADQ